MVPIFVGRLSIVKVNQHVSQVLMQSVFYIVCSGCSVVRLRSLLILLTMVPTMPLSTSLVIGITLLMRCVLMRISAIVLIHRALLLVL